MMFPVTRSPETLTRVFLIEQMIFVRKKFIDHKLRSQGQRNRPHTQINKRTPLPHNGKKTQKSLMGRILLLKKNIKNFNNYRKKKKSLSMVE